MKKILLLIFALTCLNAMAFEKQSLVCEIKLKVTSPDPVPPGLNRTFNEVFGKENKVVFDNEVINGYSGYLLNKMNSRHMDIITTNKGLLRQFRFVGITLAGSVLGEASNCYYLP